MRYLATILTLGFSLTALAQPGQTTVKRGSSMRGHLRVGGTYSATDGRTEDRRVFLNSELGATYALTNDVGLTFTLSKWIGNSRLSSESGNLAYHIAGGVVFALSGSLVEETTTEVSVEDVKEKVNGKYVYTTVTSRKISKNDFDGIRLGIKASELDFTALNYSLVGVSGNIYYEHRATENTSLQYGFNVDYARRSNAIEVVLWQGFVGIGF